MGESTDLHPSLSSVTASAPIGRGFTLKSQNRKDVIFKQWNQCDAEERCIRPIAFIEKHVLKKIWICIAKVLKNTVQPENMKKESNY